MTEKHEPLEFGLEREERPVKIGGEDYVLVELDGAHRDKYLNDLGGRLKGTGKAASVRNFDGLQGGLVAKSLFKIGADGEREPVTLKTIQTWPAQVVSGLFDAAKELSALEGDDDEDGDDEGND